MEGKILEKLYYANTWMKYAETSYDQIFKEKCMTKAYRVLTELEHELGYAKEDEK